jgi:hypothetical protein
MKVATLMCGLASSIFFHRLCPAEKGGRRRGRGGKGKRSILDHTRHLNPEDILVVHHGLGIIRWLSG